MDRSAPSVDVPRGRWHRDPGECPRRSELIWRRERIQPSRYLLCSLRSIKEDFTAFKPSVDRYHWCSAVAGANGVERARVIADLEVWGLRGSILTLHHGRREERATEMQDTWTDICTLQFRLCCRNNVLHSSNEYAPIICSRREHLPIWRKSNVPYQTPVLSERLHACPITRPP